MLVRHGPDSLSCTQTADYRNTDSHVTPVFLVIHPRAGEKQDNQQFFRRSAASCYLEVWLLQSEQSCFQF